MKITPEISFNSTTNSINNNPILFTYNTTQLAKSHLPAYSANKHNIVLSPFLKPQHNYNTSHLPSKKIRNSRNIPLQNQKLPLERPFQRAVISTEMGDVEGAARPCAARVVLARAVQVHGVVVSTGCYPFKFVGGVGAGCLFGVGVRRMSFFIGGWKREEETYLRSFLSDVMHLLEKLFRDERTVGEGNLEEAAHVLRQLGGVEGVEGPRFVDD